MADAAVEFLLGNLKKLLIYNVDLIRGVKGEVESLYDDLTLCKAFLQDKTQNTNMNELQKAFVKQIRDLIYRSEDAVEKYVALAALHKSRSPFNKVTCTIRNFPKLRRLAKDIKSAQAAMNRKLADIKSVFEGEAAVNVADGRTSSNTVNY